MPIDINCDLGESYGNYVIGNDAAVMPFITSVNIACGFHAGDPVVIEKTVKLAQASGVSMGAHPGYPDLQGFGRRDMDLTYPEIEAMIIYQIGAVAAFVKEAGSELVHIKPHGALYNRAAKDRGLAQAIVRGIKRFSHQLILVGLAGSVLVETGEDGGLITANEAFPDRQYNPDGTLMSRRLPGAVIESPQDVAQNALRLVSEGIKITLNGKTQKIRVDTLCIHGDNPVAFQNAREIRAVLEKHQDKIISLGQFLTR